MGDPDRIDELAKVEHDSWARWAQYELNTIEREFRDGIAQAEALLEAANLPNQRFVAELASLSYSGALSAVQNLECVKRWRRQIATPFADLSEKEKESDRKVVREKLDAYRDVVLSSMITLSAALLDDPLTSGFLKHRDACETCRRVDDLDTDGYSRLCLEGKQTIDRLIARSRMTARCFDCGSPMESTHSGPVRCTACRARRSQLGQS